MRISKANKIRNAFILLVILLFFVSSFSSIVFGYNDRSTSSSESAISDYPPDLDRQLENLAFYCTTPYGFNEQKYNHYKERLLNYYSSEILNDDKIIETDKEESKIQFETTSKPLTIGPMISAWPMKCHDTHHTSQSPYSTADNPGIEKWRFYTDGWVQNSPVIADDGTIYFGGNYGGLPWYLFAVNPDGTEKWRYKTGGLILGSSPAIADDGTIYIGSWDTKLYAINPDGRLKWATGSGGSIFSSPVIGNDGTIYYGTLSSGNSIVAMNPNGTIKWSYRTGDSIYSDPCIGDDGTVYIGSDDNYLYAMNPNGTLKWRFKTGDFIKSPPSIAEDGTIYIGSYDGYLYALYTNGTMRWRCPIGYGTALNPSIASDGTIYVGWDRLYAVNPNGTIKWIFNMGAQRHIDTSSPAISADGTIYFGTEIGEGAGGEIIAVNPDGTEKWCKRIANYWVESSPSIAYDGTVYIGSAMDVSCGYLHAFSPQESNNPPDAPIISGPTSGNANTEYKYTFISVDPDNNPVSFYIDWGDGTNPSWSREYASGEIAKIHHTWSEKGSYIIQVKAKDTFNGESGWAYLDVTMPRNRAPYYSSYFIKILERFPFLQKIIYLSRFISLIAVSGSFSL